MSINERALTDAERPYLPSSLAELAEVRQAILALGYSSSVANGVCSWLLAKATGQVDETSSFTRSRYRRILGELPRSEPIEPIAVQRPARIAARRQGKPTGAIPGERNSPNPAALRPRRIAAFRRASFADQRAA